MHELQIYVLNLESYNPEVIQNPEKENFYTSQKKRTLLFPSLTFNLL